MQKSFLYKDGLVFYRVIGNGLPVMLVHGFGEDSTIFNQQINFLQQHCLLIVPDLPGAGNSPLNEELVTIDDFAHCLQHLLKHENIQQCIMLGHSMGGYITLAFAEFFPLILTGFGLIHSTAYADNEEKKNNRKRGIEMMEQYGGYAFLKSTTPNLFGKKFKQEHPEKVEALIDAGQQIATKAMQQYYSAMMKRPDRTAILQDSKVPVLFIIGTEDIAAPMSDVLKQTHLANCSYIHVIEGVGHMSMWEAEEKLNAYLLDYINQ